MDMLLKENFYTGFKTCDGEKIYLGDKLQGDFYFPLLIQYDFVENKFVVTTTGKRQSPYRKYVIEDMEKLQGLRVVSNTMIYAQVAIGETVKVTVKNIKGSIFKLGEFVKITEINEWDVVAQSLTNLEHTTVLQFNEFLPAWRFDTED